MTDDRSHAQQDTLGDAAGEGWLYFYPLLLMRLTRNAEEQVYGGEGWHLEPVLEQESGG